MIRRVISWIGGNPLGGFAIGQLLVIAMLAGVNWWQHLTIADLEEWQRQVVSAVSQAVDQRDNKGRLLYVKSGEVLAHINNLGRFKTDTITAQAQARVEDAAHALATERQDAAINRKVADDYEARLAAARADADALRRRLSALSRAAVPAPVGLRPEGAAGNNQGGSGAAPVSGLSAAGPATDEASRADGLPETREVSSVEMSIAERLLATEQAIQLDELITVIENFAAARHVMETRIGD